MGNAVQLPPFEVPGGGPLCDTELLARYNLPDSDPARLRIDPWVGAQRDTLRADGGPWVPGYGLGSYGYDVRLGCKFRSLLPGEPPHYDIIDPRDPDGIWGPVWQVPLGESVTIPPHGVLLAETVETVRVPEDCVVIVLCKSTWARCFLNLNTTPLEPGWSGTVTLELANMAPRPIRIAAGDGVGQLVFFAGTACAVPYNKRRGGGRYQNQSEPTPPRADRRSTG